MAKKTALRIASNNPDEMSGGGLPSGFSATIEKARYVPWDYAGNKDMDFLAVRVDYQPDEDSGIEPFSAHYSCGKLAEFLPATADEELIDQDAIQEWGGDHNDAEAVEGVYAAAVGKREQLSKSSNWADYVNKLRDAGFPESKITPDVRFLEGAHGYFERVPQQERSGIVVQEGDEQKKRDILVMTKYDKPAGGAGKAAAKGAAAKGAAAKTKPKVEEPEDEEEAGGDDEGGDLDTRLAAFVVATLAKAPDNTLPKGKILSAVSKSYPHDDKSDAIKRVSKADFLESGNGFVFDSEDNTLTMIEPD